MRGVGKMGGPERVPRANNSMCWKAADNSKKTAKAHFFPHHQPPETYVPWITHTHTHTDTRAGNVIKLCYALVLFHPAPAPPSTPLPHPLRAIFAAAYAISYHVRHALCTFGKGGNGWRCGRELGTCRVANIIIFIIMTVVVTIKTITKTKVVSLHGN